MFFALSIRLKTKSANLFVKMKNVNINAFSGRIVLAVKIEQKNFNGILPREADLKNIKMVDLFKQLKRFC